ncbi:MAG: FISUMP domain-containing protein [Paludibacter sp.]|nr:FISUMP domain-containing protein [Paludibacter sp.]
MKKNLLSLIIVLSALALKAQVVDICGGDTVTLTVDNYVNGLIEWQESMDNVEWVTIPNATGLTYKFFPTENKYYRASVKTSTCDILYSEVSLVQLPPVANAGSDRTIGNPSTNLLGNSVTGATGEWRIISGVGGAIEDTSNPRSSFTGADQESYTLTWTLTNSCGESTDTVVIDFDLVVVRNNFIMVDNTDSIFSDSLEIESGTYKIKFSDPSIVPFDSLVLIGIRDDLKFIRRVVSYTLQDSVYTFETVQGTFQDVIQSGSLNLGDAVNESMSEDESPQSASYYKAKKINKLPTRKMLSEYANTKGIHIFYTESGIEDNNGRMLVKSNVESTTDDDGFKLTIPDCTLLQTEDEELTLNLSDTWVKIAPNFILDYKLGFMTIKKIKIGIDNGYFQTNYKLGIEAKAEKSFEKEKELFKLSKNIFFTIGGLPVWVETKFDIKTKASLSVGAKLSYEQSKNYKASLTALIEGDKIKNLHVNYKPLTVVSTTTQSCNIQGEIEASLEIGPEVQFKLYSIIGPYVYIPAKATLEVCANTHKNWQMNADLFFEGKLGAKATLFGCDLFDCSYDLFKTKSLYNLTMPYNLEVLSGNNQQGAPYTQLPVPVKFKVTSNKGFGVPFVRVKFDITDGDGTLSDSVATTDMKGETEVYWTPGITGSNVMTASVLDCSDTDVNGSPLTVYANAPLECGNSNFTINISTNGNYKVPEVSGGHPPYSYSTNGIDYSSDIPQFSLDSAGNFIVYSKDNYGCIESKSFVIEPVDICRNSDLTADIFSQLNFITVTGKDGVEPYQYALDDSTAFSSINAFYKLNTGTHTVYIKDANNCRNSIDVTIEKSNAAINVVYPLSASTVEGNGTLTFKWTAGNYVSGQIYDVYLAESDNDFILIGNNILTDSLIYTTPLDISTNYRWKIVVKNNEGVELDELISDFSTSDGMTIEAPDLVYPAPDEVRITDNQIPLMLKWSNQGSDFLYDVYCDNKNASSLIANNVPDTTYTLNEIIPGVNYDWKVKVKSKATGESMYSEIRSFKSFILPVVNADTVPVSIEYNNAQIAYQIKSIGGDSTCVHGICWSTSENPTADDSSTTTDTGIGDFTKTLSNLSSLTTYYARVFATNIAGTVYSPQIVFTTKELSNDLVADIDGNVYHAVKIGTQTWMVENLKTTHYRNGDAIDNLTDNTEWNASTQGAWCNYNNLSTNGDIYGHLYNFYAVADSRNLAPEGWHTATNAEWNTLVTYLGGASVAGGAMKSIGTTYWKTNVGATNSSGFSGLPGGYRDISLGFYSINSSGLWHSSESGTTSSWYRCLYANQTYTTSYSFGKKNTGMSVRCVKDLASTPTIATDTVSEISSDSFVCGGEVISDGGASVTSRGICWSMNSSPTISDSVCMSGTGIGSFSCNITGLSSQTTYYIRSFATNSEGTAYGNEVIVKTANEENTVTDIDGNVYHTVTIGTQTWMVENLKTTHYRNGDEIPNVTSTSTWISLTSGAWCTYNNVVENAEIYGNLYNWYAVNDSRNIAPEGWHVPTSEEWTILSSYLSTNVGGKMKQEGTTYWQSPNTNATNSSGFTGLPGGYLYRTGSFMYINRSGNWWTSTGSGSFANGTALTYSDGNLNRYGDYVVNGFSIRCIKDN